MTSPESAVSLHTFYNWGKVNEHKFFAGGQISAQVLTVVEVTFGINRRVFYRQCCNTKIKITSVHIAFSGA